MEKLKKHTRTIREPNPVRQGVYESRDVEVFVEYEMGEKINELVQAFNELTDALTAEPELRIDYFKKFNHK